MKLRDADTLDDLLLRNANHFAGMAASASWIEPSEHAVEVADHPLVRSLMFSHTAGAMLKVREWIRQRPPTPDCAAVDPKLRDNLLTIIKGEAINEREARLAVAAAYVAMDESARALRAIRELHEKASLEIFRQFGPYRGQ